MGRRGYCSTPGVAAIVRGPRRLLTYLKPRVGSLCHSSILISSLRVRVSTSYAFTMRSGLLLALSSAGASLVSALGQKPVVSFNGTSSDFQIAGGSIKVGQILVSENDYWGVIRAAGDLAIDFGRVTGTNYTLSTDSRLSGSNASAVSNSTASGAAAAVYSFNPVNNQNNTFVSLPRDAAEHVPRPNSDVLI